MRQRLKQAFWLHCSLIAALGAALVSAEDREMMVQRELVVPSLEREELLAVRIDSQIYRAAQPGLADLRVLDDEHREIPYLVRKLYGADPETTRRYWTAGRPTLRPLEENGLEVTLHLNEDDPRASGLRIVTPLQNFEQRVQAFSSAGGDAWQPLGEPQLIYDYSQFMDFRSVDVDFPATDSRHLRIVIDQPTLEQESELIELTRSLRQETEGEPTERRERVLVARRPFRIDRVELWSDVEESGPLKTGYPSVTSSVKADPERQRTIVRVDAGREPLTSLTLQTASNNFSRAASLEVLESRGVRETWRKLASAELTRFRFRDFTREQLRIEFPETRAAAYRILLENRDSPPVKITGVTAEGNAYEAVFFAQPERRYRLTYGAADREAPAYDAAAIQTLLEQGFEPAAVELGPAAEVKTEPAAWAWSKLLSDARLLVGIILALAAAVAWGLYHAARRIDAPEQP